jgi:hypothetical protein
VLLSELPYKILTSGVETVHRTVLCIIKRIDYVAFDFAADDLVNHVPLSKLLCEAEWQLFEPVIKG